MQLHTDWQRVSHIRSPWMHNTTFSRPRSKRTERRCSRLKFATGLFCRLLFCHGGTIQPSKTACAGVRTRVLEEDSGWFPPLTSRK